MKKKHEDFFNDAERYIVKIGALIIFAAFVTVEVVDAVKYLLR